MMAAGASSAAAAAAAGSVGAGVLGGRRGRRRDLKYSRLNLNIDSYGVRVQPRITIAKRTVSLYWAEKLWALVYFIQLSALLWIMSSAWPWPFRWLEWSRWCLLLVLDLPTYFSHASMSFYSNTAHTVLVLLVPAAIYGGYVFAVKYWYDAMQGPPPFMPRRLVFEKTAVQLADFLYIPVILAGFRTITCDDSKLVLIDSGISCFSAPHFVLVIIAGCTALPFALLYPYVLYGYTKPLAVFQSVTMHEKYLQSREIEYLMGINNLYQVDRVYLVSSFRRYFVHYRAGICVQKFLLVAVVHVFGKHMIDLPELQALLFTIIVAAPVVLNFFVRQYRAISTEYQRGVLAWALVIVSMIGIFSAGQVQNAFLVASTLSIILAMIYGTALVLFLVLVIYAYCKKQHWPITLADVDSILDRDMEMVTAINESKRMLDEAFDCPPEMMNKDDVRDQILIIDRFRRSARASGHVLEWTLQDLTEDLAMVLEQIRNVSMLPDEELEDALTDVGPRLRAKQFDRALLHPAKTRMLQKMLVMRQLLGDDFLHGNRVEWDDSDEELDGEDGGVARIAASAGIGVAPPVSAVSRLRSGYRGALSPLQMQTLLGRLQMESSGGDSGDGDGTFSTSLAGSYSQLRASGGTASFDLAAKRRLSDDMMLLTVQEEHSGAEATSDLDGGGSLRLGADGRGDGDDDDGDGSDRAINSDDEQSSSVSDVESD
eukprot:TRINITY_DN65595_c8_g3_i1.p1 TRINITY_DN65595_c8_g3~~TRINITY_DN65595_c8_g3_i1.p1  ORF type:complete len:727 (-),score=357.74 TRINITY_DN65595_c8_g3_i1:57-2195(-)